MRIVIGHLLLPLLLLVSNPLFALEPILIDDRFVRTSAETHSEMLREAPVRELAQLMADTAGWQPLDGPVRIAYSEDSVWQRFALRNVGSNPVRLRLEIANPLIDQLDIHLLRDRAPVTTFLLGDTRPAANRIFASRHVVVPIDLAAGTTMTIYLRGKSHGALKLPVTVWHESALIAEEQRSLLLLTFLYGAILSTLLVFLFTVRGTRERGFHSAVLFILTITWYQAQTDGVINLYFPIDGLWWNEYKTVIAGLATTLVGLLFTARILDLPARLPATRPLLWTAFLTYGLLLPLLLIISGHSALPALTISMLVYAACSLLLGLYALSRRLPAAGTYLALIIPYLLGATVSGLDRFAILPLDASVNLAFLGCIFLQLGALGYVLVQRIRGEMIERESAEQLALSARKRAVAAEWHMAYELEREAERQTEALSQTMKELRDANRQLADMSLHDGLTGLHNRRHFDERYPALVQLAARRQEPLAVMMLDIDHFKQVNDGHGHLTGDDCLRQVAGTLRHVLGRSTDLLARYGGEEFVIVLPATGEPEAAVIAERIRLAVEATPIPNSGRPLCVTASIGLAVRIPGAGDGDELLKAADAALYRAKKNGRNRVER